LVFAWLQVQSAAWLFKQAAGRAARKRAAPNSPPRPHMRNFICQLWHCKRGTIFPEMPAGTPSTPHMKNFLSQLCSNVISMPDFHLELEQKYSKSEVIFICILKKFIL
jgi:hypothetical protein